MSKKEIEIILNNVIYGDYKFLYVSPERLQNYYFREMLKNMTVNLLTIDEAHCISQWGYDFRPPYLQISEIRQLLPANTPVLALTATATPDVVKDIQDKLEFAEYNVIRKSFERKNLFYSVVYAEDKVKILCQLLNKHPGCGVIYVRNRKKTKEFAELLKKYGVSADFYHAGLSTEEREKKQNDWQNDKIRLMVCTNAFGMGIDKPNVRIVVHLDLPDSPEAYFQEAGRAGRDGKKAEAFLLFNNQDIGQLKKNITVGFPEYKKVEEIYNGICNYFEIPEGEGEDTNRIFDIFEFAKLKNIDVTTIVNAMKMLEYCNILQYNTDADARSRMRFICTRDELYNYELFSHLDFFIKAILRLYVGIFTDFIFISEEYIAKVLNITEQKVFDYLKELQQRNLIDYIPKSKKPFISFFARRNSQLYELYDAKIIESLKNRVVSRTEAMLLYAQSKNKCRSQQLLAYFGEKTSKPCGYCDVCQQVNSLGLTKYEFETIGLTIKSILQKEEQLLTDLIDSIPDFESNKTAKFIQWAFDNDRMIFTNDRKLKWIKD
jgi:ATP-dependent DNA helicase RecQ